MTLSGTNQESSHKLIIESAFEASVLFFIAVIIRLITSYTKNFKTILIWVVANCLL